MCSVFLSYARRDSEFALKLIRDLGSLGVAVWMDDHDVPGGSRWDEAIPDAVTGCSALLVVLSPESVKSHNVLDEVGLALDQGKRVLPVLFETCDIPFRLRRIQYIDCSREYARGLASLERALRAAELIPPANHSQSLTASNPLQTTFVVDGTLGWQATGIRLIGRMPPRLHTNRVRGATPRPVNESIQPTCQRKSENVSTVCR